MAMSNYGLGQVDEAKVALANAQAILRDKMPDPAQGRPFAGEWHDWLHAQILCGQAEAVLKKERRR